MKKTYTKNAKPFIVFVLITMLLLSTSSCSVLEEGGGGSIKDTAMGVLYEAKDALLDFFGLVYNIVVDEDEEFSTDLTDENDGSSETDEPRTPAISHSDQEVYKPIIKRYRDSTIVHAEGYDSYNQPVDLLGTRSRILSTVNRGVYATAYDCYYTYFDIDGNGTPELLISNENRDTGFVDVYTISEDRVAKPVFFGDFTGRTKNINNASLLQAGNGTFIVLETGDEKEYGLFVYYVSENCTKVEFSDSIWVEINDGTNPDTIDKKGEPEYFNGSTEITKEKFDELEEIYAPKSILYDWAPIQFVNDYKPPLEDLKMPDKTFASKPYTVTTTLKVRKTPDIGADVFDEIPIGTFINAIGEQSINKKWVLIRYNDEYARVYRFGWARTEYLQEGHIVQEKKPTRKKVAEFGWKE